ncbi:MAG: hypothetical protein RI924_911, partial [Bacteroidota bacterium]
LLLIMLQLSCNKDDSAGPEYGTVADIEGNVYKTVKIGDQEWMAENLRVTHYNTGITAQDAIPLIVDDNEWENLGSIGTAAYCYYDGDLNKLPVYGALYNGYAVKSGKLAPKGWHVPTDEDWERLRNYLIANGYNYDGSTVENKVAKSLASKTEWKYSQLEGTIGKTIEMNNKTGFNALPAGYRQSLGYYDGSGGRAVFWSSSLQNTERSGWNLYYESDLLIGPHPNNQLTGFSVRCVKD